MATKQKTHSKPAVSKKNENHSARARQRPKYKSFKLSKTIKHPAGPLPSSWKLVKATFKTIKPASKPLLGVLIVYILLTVVLVQGFQTPVNVGDLKENVQTLLGDQTNSLVTNLTAFSLLVSSSTEVQNEAAGVYQSLILLVITLCTVWILRQVHAGKKATTKLAFYDGLYPLVPFLLVLLVMTIQLIPLRIGTFLFSATVGSGIAATGIEVALWTLLMVGMVIWSLYLLTSSAFALFIVTLPNMTPMVSLRSAKRLVEFRRWTVLRRMVLGILILVGGALILIAPVLFFVDILAPYLFFVCLMLTPFMLVSYLFTLYKELL